MRLSNRNIICITSKFRLEIRDGRLDVLLINSNNEGLDKSIISNEENGPLVGEDVKDEELRSNAQDVIRKFYEGRNMGVSTWEYEILNTKGELIDQGYLAGGSGPTLL